MIDFFINLYFTVALALTLLAAWGCHMEYLDWNTPIQIVGAILAIVFWPIIYPISAYKIIKAWRAH